ncbi:hypothetical protein HZA99_01120 [Candidatus Woesearchaeota archaeon]|nr:hypothetical protein [Candidatus Woesearchaeota archaeon]
MKVISKAAREILKAEFERWLHAEVPRSMILDFANHRPVNERLSTDVTVLQRTWNEDEQKARVSALATTALTDCLAEHCLYGSTTEITPNPFAPPLSYLEGQAVDVYDRVRENKSSV